MSDSVIPVLSAMTPPRMALASWLVLGGGILMLAVLSLWIWTPGEAQRKPVEQAMVSNASQMAAVSDVAPVTPDSLREQTRRYPRDGRGWALLAYALVEQEAYAEAAAAFEKAVAVSPKVAADPGVLCDWADALGMAQGGKLHGRPTELVHRALALRSDYPKALEMAGSAAYEERQFALAADYWSRLLPQMQDGTAVRRALEQGVARAKQLAASQP